MKLAITFGALAPTIADQLRQQGAEAAGQLVNQWQRDAKSITRLAVRCLLSEAEVTRARRRLLRDILHGARVASTSTQTK